MFYIDFIYGSTGGTENQLIKLMNNLDHEKFELYLLCLRDTPWLEENRSKLKCTVAAFNYNEFNHAAPRNLMVFWKTVNHMKKVRPDIVVIFFKIRYILGVLAARLAGVKSIISTRRDYGLWLDDRSIYALRFANRFLRGIITNSQQVKELTCLKEHFDRSNVHVIYNGIEADKFRQFSGPDISLKASLGIPLSNKVVGIVAGLRPMKRHKTFLLAASKVLEIRRDVNFLIIGDGTLRGELENHAAELDIKENVHFLGWQHDIVRYLSIFDIGVNCSMNEGLSNAIMEYMAAGVPCIVSDAGGNRELLHNGDNGLVFPLDDHHELVRCIEALLADEATRKTFIDRSRRRIEEHFSIENMIAAYEGLFQEVFV